MTPITALGSRYGIQGALGRSVKRASTASTWWDLNGTITSCVAAYQPKGAASYAASLTDLSGNSNDATEGVAPTWATGTGWTFDGVDDYLDTGVNPLDNQGWSAFIRIANNNTNDDTKHAFGVGISFRSRFSVVPRYNNTYSAIANDTRVIITSAVADSGVLGFSGARTFINAVYKGTCPVDTSNTFSGSVYIGTSNGATTFWAGDVLALVIYDGTLTDDQVSDLTTAMAAL